MTTNTFLSKLSFPTQGTTGKIVPTNKFLHKLTFPTQGTTGKIVPTKFLPKLTFRSVGAKCDAEQISAQIDVLYSGHNGGNCADEQISVQIDVPCSGDNGVNCADEQISAEIDVPFLGCVGAKCDAEHWSAEIEVNGHDTKFKLDTCAGVSVVSDRETWLQSENLLTTKQTLPGPGGTLLPVMGVIKARLRHRNKSLDELVYFIRNQEYSLLNRRACVGLDLVARFRQCPRKHE